MEHRSLGEAGPQVSLVGLGCNNFGGRIDLAATRAVVHKALDLGITLFDTADIYGERNGSRGGSEEQLGQVLGARRKDIVLATKFGMAMDASGKRQGAARAYILTAVEDSLKRLKTDWIDLYQLHRPDPKTPIEETLRALDDLVQQGKVRFIGNSNLTGAQVDEAAATSARLGLAAFVSCQNEYSLVERKIERELVPAMVKHKLGFLPFFPLASGLLTGKYKRGEALPEGSRLRNMGQLAERYMSEANWRIVTQLEAFCSSRNHTLLDLAFSWLAAKPFVSSVIAGATKPEQLEQNVRAVSWKLTPAEMTEVDRITAGAAAD